MEAQAQTRPRALRWLGRLLFALVLLFVLGLYLVFGTSVFLADIRPSQAKPSPLAQQWYKKALKAHGGLQHWKQRKSVQYHLTARFKNAVIRKLLGPFADTQVALHWTYTSGRSWPQTLKAKYKNGAQEEYRIQEKTITQIVKGKKNTSAPRLRFFARSIRHLLDFVFAMGSADILWYAGKAQWKGKTYVRLYMTWKNPKANHDVDQYILWINKQTHLVERFDCTGRHILPVLGSPFLKARVEYTGYRKLHGVPVPTKIQVFRAGSGRQFVHGYTIHGMKPL
ncbi:MAG: hypothetical protein EP343_08880 [Deltaproteobacteria bacterium]|nr:MAG: hypothetical protein EP343_08880 [Deltaproteobacteria bacterium]